MGKHAVTYEMNRVDGEGAGVPETVSGLPVLTPGRVAVLSGDPGTGMTRLGLVMLARHAGTGMAAYLDVRGWLSPLAAWEAGIDPERMVIVRCSEAARWGRAAAALLDGVTALFAEVPAGMNDAVIRRLAALARHRGTVLLLRPLDRSMPGGIAHLTIEADAPEWIGAERGHGRIGRRTIRFAASGKAMRGMTRMIEMEDDGSHDVHLVPGVAASPARSTAG